ncbi:hypothetical protein PITC_038740 [Penicillium italicum]|uniref:Uncharacterized protein n=1 Tax=Penicillium italicum TaxID=40296 RepID=A0A0A2KK81_PENIT|nr:hypothetical protein PITC_038740 [Penicillium italicum]
MENNITNIISIVVNALPTPPLPTSATQSSPSPSASGTSRSVGQQLVAAPGFWALLIVVVGCLAGSGYLIWRRPASKGEDLEDILPKDVIAGEQPEEAREKIPEGDDVKAGPPPVTPETPKTPKAPETPETPAPSTTPKKKKKKRLGPAELASFSTIGRNTAHGVKEGFASQPSAEIAALVC